MNIFIEQILDQSILFIRFLLALIIKKKMILFLDCIRALIFIYSIYEYILKLADIYDSIARLDLMPAY